MSSSRTTRHRLHATLLAAALASVLLHSTAHANHANGHEGFHYPPQYSQEFLQHHGAMIPKAKPGQPARFGVAITALSSDELDRLSLEYGVRVEQVVGGSVAEAAGVQVDDIITELSGRPAYSPERLQHLVGEAGDTAPVTVLRNGKAVELQASFSKVTQAGKPALGVRIQEMTDDLKQAFGASDDRGVLIAQVRKNSGAALAGLKAGDVVVSIDGEDMTSVADIQGTVSKRSPGDTLTITYLRDRQQAQTDVALGNASAQSHPHAGKHHGRYKHGMDKHGSRLHGPYGHPHHACHAGKGQRRS